MPEPAGITYFRRSSLLALFVAGVLLATTGAARARDDPYRKVLRAWAEDPSTRPVLDLVELERQSASEIGGLQRYQRRTLRQLVDRERRGSIAVAVLHQVAFRAHAQGGDRDLVAHSMEMSDQALALGLRAEKSIPEVRPAAAILNTAMALALRDHRFVDAAAQRLHRAIELDPELAFAYDWAASAEEQRGRLGRARDLLRRLTVLDPENRAARLRLARISMKLGDPAAAGMLEALVADADASPGTDRSWVWIVAVQELAQAYARTGQEAEAVDLLRRATAEVPDDQGLAIALAFFDRAHRRPSRALLESLVARGALDSARVTYGAWTQIEPFAEKVETTLVEHLPYLARALQLTDPRR